MFISIVIILILAIGTAWPDFRKMMWYMWAP